MLNFYNNFEVIYFSKNILKNLKVSFSQNIKYLREILTSELILVESM